MELKLPLGLARLPAKQLVKERARQPDVAKKRRKT
jgi:hypothetical protein